MKKRLNQAVSVLNQAKRSSKAPISIESTIESTEKTYSEYSDKSQALDRSRYEIPY